MRIRIVTDNKGRTVLRIEEGLRWASYRPDGFSAGCEVARGEDPVTKPSDEQAQHWENVAGDVVDWTRGNPSWSHRLAPASIDKGLTALGQRWDLIVGSDHKVPIRPKYQDQDVLNICRTNSRHHGKCIRTVWAVRPTPAGQKRMVALDPWSAEQYLYGDDRDQAKWAETLMERRLPATLK